MKITMDGFEKNSISNDRIKLGVSQGTDILI